MPFPWERPQEKFERSPVDDLELFITESVNTGMQEYVPPKEREDYFRKIGLGQLDGDADLQAELVQAPRSRLEEILKERQRNNNRNLASTDNEWLPWLGQKAKSAYEWVTGEKQPGAYPERPTPKSAPSPFSVPEPDPPRSVAERTQEILKGYPPPATIPTEVRNPRPTALPDDPFALTPLGGMSQPQAPAAPTRQAMPQQGWQQPEKKVPGPYTRTTPGAPPNLTPELNAMREGMGKTVPRQNRTTLPKEQEAEFQKWYRGWAQKAGIDPNPDDPHHQYDYRGAFLAGVTPSPDPTDDNRLHWPSEFKDDDHPTRFKNGIDTRTGQRVAPSVNLSQQKIVEPPKEPSTMDSLLSVLPFGGFLQSEESQHQRAEQTPLQEAPTPQPSVLRALSPLGMLAETLSDDTKREQLAKDTWQATGSAMQGLAQVPAGSLKSVGIAAKMIDEQLPQWMQQHGDQTAQEMATYKMGQSLQEAAAKAFPTDPDRQREFLVSVLPSALGSMVGFLGGGLASSALGGARTLSTMALGAGAQAPGMFEEAQAAGPQESTETPMGIADVLSPLGSLAKHAGERSEDPDVNARKAFLLGLGIGATEAIPIERAISRIDTASKGQFSEVLSHGLAGAEEFIQEFFQGTANNAVAQSLYDEHRNLFEGVGAESTAGGISGFMMSVILGMMKAKGGGPVPVMPQGQPHAVEPPPSQFDELTIPGVPQPSSAVEAVAEAGQPEALPPVDLPVTANNLGMFEGQETQPVTAPLEEEGPLTEDAILSALGVSFPKEQGPKLIKKQPSVQLEGPLTLPGEPVPENVLAQPTTLEELPPPKPLGKRAQAKQAKTQKAQLADLYDSFRYADALDDQETMQQVADQLEAQGQPLPDPETFTAWADQRDALMAAKKSLGIAGHERGFKTFSEVEGQGGTKEVQASRSPTDEWYKTLTTKPAASKYLVEGQKAWDKNKIDRALEEGLALLPGEQPSANVQVLLEAIQSDPKFHDLLVAEPDAPYQAKLFEEETDQPALFGESEEAVQAERKDEPVQVEEKAKPAKEPWEMTALEYSRSRVPDAIRDKITTPQKTFMPQHHKEIEAALHRGKPVPPEVLADYPDLQPTEGTSKPPPYSFQQDDDDPFALTPLAEPTRKAKAKPEPQPELFGTGETLQTGVSPIIGREATMEEAPLFSKSAQEEDPEQLTLMERDAPYEGKEATPAKPTEPKFYSQLQRTIEQKMPNAASPQQIMGIVKGGQVKQDELEWSGLEEFLADKPKASKQEVLDFLKANEVEVQEVVKGKDLSKEENARRKTLLDKYENDVLTRNEEIELNALQQRFGERSAGTDTKFSQYTLPGGHNYREHLLTLPEKQIDELTEQEASELSRLSVKRDRGTATEQELDRLRRIRQKMDAGDKRGRENFRSSHFDEPNILAHTRTTDRTGPNGEKILFVEEVQSDYGIELRKRAKRKAKEEGLKENTPEFSKRLSALMNDPVSLELPNFPFKGKQYELAMKKMLMQAVTDGYDQLSWITGEETAKRYDLSKQVDEVQWSPEFGSIRVKERGKEAWTFLKEGGVTEENLADYIGKDPAQKLIQSPQDGTWKSLSGTDLSIGGEWAKSLYDKMIPQFLKKFTKKWGGTVETSHLGTSTAKNKDFFVDEDTRNGTFQVISERTGEVAGDFDTRQEAEGFIAHQEGSQKTQVPVHTLTITPAMRDSLGQEGVALFEKEALDEPRISEAKERPVQFAEGGQRDRPADRRPEPGRPVRGHATSPLREGGGVRTLGKRLTAQLERVGRLDLRGATVRNANDLAELAQIYRNPQYETLRVWYVKDGKVVGHEGLTSRLPNVVAFAKNTAGIQDYLDRIATVKTRLKADGYYLQHNHPSGDPTASQEDINLTAVLAQEIPGFRGHVIINHGKYAVLEAQEALGLPGEPVGTEITETFHPIANRDFRADPHKAHPLLGLPMTKANILAELGKRIQTPTGYTTVIYRGAKGRVEAIQEVPDNMVLSDDFKGYIRNATRDFGAVSAYTYSNDPEAAVELATMELVEQGVLRDALTDGQDGLRSAREFVRPLPEKINLSQGRTAPQAFKRTRKVMEEEAPYRDQPSSSARMRPMANKEGAGSTPSPHPQEPGRNMTDSPAFKRWFGNSKVVDAEGQPLVVYHGTTRDFNMFDSDKHGLIGYMKNAFHFTDNAQDASRHYARRRIYQDEGDHAGAIIPVYLSLGNPIIIDKNSNQLIDPIKLKRALTSTVKPFAVQTEQFYRRLEDIIGHAGPFSPFELDRALGFIDIGAFIDTNNKQRKGIGEFYIRTVYQALGFDGAIINAKQQFPEMRKIPKGTKHYIVFSPTQIKSAIGNKGTFDPTNPSIVNEQDAPYEGRQSKPSARAFADIEQHEASARRSTALTPRIPPAPITGQPPKKLRDILRDASKDLNQKLWKGKTGRGAAGVYKPGSQAVVLRHANDLDTAAHELGHALDDRFDFLGSPSHFPFDSELAQFWQHGSVTATGPRSTLAYKRAEGVAEWMRAYLINPVATEQQAPRFTKHVLSHLTVEVKEAIDKFGKEIRAFAGASGAQKIQANIVATDDEKPTLKERIFGTPPGPGFQLRPIDRAAAKWTDRLAPVMRAYEWAREQQGLTTPPLPQDDPRVLARLLMGSNAAMDDIVKNGMTLAGKPGRATPGGVDWLMSPLLHDSPEILKQELLDTSAFMIAQRTLEKAKQFGRTSHVSGIGGGLADDVTVAQQTLDEFGQDPVKLARLTEAASRYRQWATSTLDYLLEQGRISQEQYDGILLNNEYYVAMKRLVEITPDEEIAVVVPKSTLGRHSNLGAVKQPIQAFKGSDLSIKDPFEQLLNATNQAVREADRNHIIGTFVDLLDTQRGMHQGRPADLASVARLAKAGEPHTIPYYRNGVKEIWQFHPDVYKALKGIGDSPVRLPGVFTIMPRILRTTIVNAPSFAVRNVIRDTMHRTIISNNQSKPWDTFKRYSKMDISDLRRFGGDQAGHYYTDDQQYMRAMKAAMEELAGKPGHIVATAHKLGRGYLNLMQASERQGRLAEYRRAYQQAISTGVDLGDGTKTVLDPYNASLYAAKEARGLIDYAVAGEYMNWINQLVPFSNAAVQGARVVLKQGAKAPTRLLWRTMLYAAVPSLMTWLWNWEQDDLEEYRELPAYQRDLFWNFKVGPDLWFHLPKPFELGMIGSSVERLMDRAAGNEKAFEGHGSQLWHTLLPVDEGALAGPFQGVVQALTNYDLFRQKHIVPIFEENLELGLRKTWRASRLGQLIQEVVGVDARKIDFLARQQFGYFGQYATRLSDIGRPEARTMGMTDTGLFKGAPAAAALDVQWVMNRAKERGALSTKEFRQFREHVNRYYDAESRVMKEAAAKALRFQAARLRAKWEANPPRPKAEQKRAKKMFEETTPDPFLELLGVQ